MLRGRGRVTVRGEVALALERVTYWDGFDTATETIADPARAAAA